MADINCFMDKMESWVNSLSSQMTQMNKKLESIELQMKKMKVIEEMVEKVKEENSLMKNKMNEIEKSLSFLSAEYDELKQTLKANDKEIRNLSKKNEMIDSIIEEQRKQKISSEDELCTVMNPIQLEKRANNLELHSIAENEEENLNEKVSEIIKKVCPGNVEFIKVFRFGFRFNKDGSLRKRPILIIFKNKVMRDTVYVNKSN